MSATYLIDGYNLLFALGILHDRAAPARLAQARRRLLGLLRGAHETGGDDVTVVFDAAGAPAGVKSEQTYHGLHIRFAVDHPEADDLIELLIRQSSTPKDLYVVSDDHRIQQAARRRECQVLGCGAYMDRLDRQPPRQAPEASEKVGGLSESETQEWLSEFADLDSDPDFKELFNPFDFDEE